MTFAPSKLISISFDSNLFSLLDAPKIIVFVSPFFKLITHSLLSNKDLTLLRSSLSFFSISFRERSGHVHNCVIGISYGFRMF